MPSALVIGTDGLIGDALLRRLQAHGWVTVGTTRRAVGDAALVRFDLTDPPAALLAAPAVGKLASQGDWVAFLGAAITGYAPCAQDPVATRRINVTNSVRLVGILMEAGAFVVYPSSNAVFEGATGRCNESSRPSAISEYGRQKADAEQAMLRLVDRTPRQSGLAVVRLTKVVTAKGLVGQWLETLRTGGDVEAATNLLLSPISLQFGVRCLTGIAAARRGGIYHLSGEGVVSYFEFALGLARALGAASAQVKPCEVPPSPGAGPSGGAALDMSYTTRYLNLTPQPVDSVIVDLLSPS